MLLVLLILKKKKCLFVFKTIVATSFTCAPERSKLENVTVNVLYEQNVMVIVAVGDIREFGLLQVLLSGLCM
jgi:hypothetical protein